MDELEFALDPDVARRHVRAGRLLVETPLAVRAGSPAEMLDDVRDERSLPVDAGESPGHPRGSRRRGRRTDAPRCPPCRPAVRPPASAAPGPGPRRTPSGSRAPRARSDGSQRPPRRVRTNARSAVFGLISRYASARSYGVPSTSPTTAPALTFRTGDDRVYRPPRLDRRPEPGPASGPGSSMSLTASDDGPCSPLHVGVSGPPGPSAPPGLRSCAAPCACRVARARPCRTPGEPSGTSRPLLPPCGARRSPA